MRGVEAPQLHMVPCGEVSIAVWEWPGHNPPLVFAHATGFHGRCWDHIARLFPDRRALAIEFRGHGRSSKPAPPIPWREFAQDVLALAHRFEIHDAVGVGHSMGGHSLVSAAIQQPDIFNALVLVDPVIFPPEFYGAGTPDADYIERRRNRWESPAAMYERFRSRPPFVAWQPDALKNYCDYGLLPDGDSFVLACPPATEAWIYRLCNAPESNLYAGIPSVGQPVTILRAGTTQSGPVLDLNASPTAPDLAAKFPHARDIFLPDHNHYIPMEAPQLVAAEIAHFCSNKSAR